MQSDPGSERWTVAAREPPADLDSARMVVFSPHFDDAVLAVGGLIAARVGAGREVTVLTVFSSGDAQRTRGGRRGAFADYGVRQDEDDRALALLGAGRQRLGLAERLFRQPAPHGPLRLFRTYAALADSSEVAVVREAIRDALSDEDTVVLAPLGIGNHVDHVIVAVAALRSSGRILFYEDFNALSELCRRRHPVSRLLPLSFRSAPGWASPPLGLQMAMMAGIARGPHPPSLAGLPVRAAEWSVSRARIDERPKLRAVVEYRTQTKALGGERPLLSMLRRAHATRGGELLWQRRAGRS